MSYVRFSSVGRPWGYNSDVYIYDDTNGGITCCGCCNVPTHAEMIDHVKEHIEKRDAVPEFVIRRLMKCESHEPGHLDGIERHLERGISQ